MQNRAHLIIFMGLLIAIAGLTTLGPREQALGANVRLVYLHGAWVWTALLGFAIAALLGIIGPLLDRRSVIDWSITTGRVATFFWLTYIPLSLWTMQANWNGLYLAEPRFKVAIDFAITGMLFQIALLLLKQWRWGVLLNSFYFVALWVTLRSAEQVMHPPSPIMTSDSIVIRLFFFLLVGLCLLAAWQLSLWLQRRKPV
jgi:hypothetical protein